MKKLVELIFLTVILVMNITYKTYSQDFSEFKKYINHKDRIEFKNVLVLGVSADNIVAKDYTDWGFDLIISISKDGNAAIDYVKAGLDKFNITTGRELDVLKGAHIENLYAHSWGSSRVINTLENIGSVKQLHLMGSPHSTNHMNLNQTNVGKIHFHINERDGVSNLSWIPSSPEFKYSGKVEVHLYKTKQNSLNYEQKGPLTIPIFGAPLGNFHHIYFNSPVTDHGLKKYFMNMNEAYHKNPNYPITNDSPIFYPTHEMRRIHNKLKNTNPHSLEHTQLRAKWDELSINYPDAERRYLNSIPDLPKIRLGSGDYIFNHSNIIYKNERISNYDLQRNAKLHGADFILQSPDRREWVIVRRRDEYLPPFHNFGGGGNQPPPPPPPPSPSFVTRPASQPPPSSIGGVYLSNVARADETTSVQTGMGSFSFIFNGDNNILDLDEYKRFITSLWSVYFDSSPPGISIDPISTNPDVADVQMVRYIGNVINNDLGRVMREADYLMKKWAVGTEKPDINGFKDVDELMAASNINYFGASRRFWFVPEEMRFTAGDGYCIFTGGKMVLNTEYLFLDNKAAQAEPADIAFAEFFTENYDEIAEKYPIYRELYDYAKLVSLANYLKQNKIPSLWFLLANKHFVISEDSPGTVEQLVKSSEYFKGTQIVGGVDPNAPAGNYVYDSKTISAINNAWEVYRSQSGNSESVTFTSSNKTINIEINERELTIVDNYALTTHSDLMGNRYQTDLSLWSGNNPGLELVRISNNDLSSPGDFGYGWNFLRLYKIEVLPNDSVIWNNMIWKKHCTVKNLITGKVDTLVFNPEQYNYIGYSPVYPETSEFILLMPKTNGGFELADKLGNYFVFNHNGDLSQMTLGSLRKNHVRFNIPVCNPDKHQDIPYYLHFADSYVDFGRFRVSKSVELVDRESGSKHTFRINKNSNSLEYTPAGKSPYDKLIVLNTGEFILYDLSGKQYHFNQYGCITDIISGQEYTIEYAYFDNGIDNFSTPLLDLNQASNNRLTVEIGDYELLMPAKLSVKNLKTGAQTFFNFVESDTCICYLPEQQQSQFKALYLLTNGHYLVETKNGYEIYFDESGRLSAINSYDHEYMKSFQQGDYIAKFSYTLLGNGIPVVDKIRVYRNLEWKLLYELKYEYDDNGFLINSSMLLADN